MLGLTAAQLAAIRVEALVTVPESERWNTEAAALREHRPPFNDLLPATLDAKRAKWNAYQRTYSKAYLAANPDKAQAKRDADRARIAAKRAAAKVCRVI